MAVEGIRTVESALRYQADQYYAHRMYYNVAFENQDMDYWFQAMLGTESTGGAATGEMFYAASQIEDGNFASWNKEFSELAGRVAARAEISLARNHAVSARQGFLRASNYYRWSVYTAVDVEVYLKTMRMAQACFHKAASLFDPPIEPIEVPYEGKTLPGYFWKPVNDDEPRKTFIKIGGGETANEDMFFFIGPHTIERGYNFVTVDLPGQGVTPKDGFTFRADTEVPMGAVLDYVLERPEVDAERVAASGQSMGGYFVPRAAVYDKRLKAVIGNAVYTDVFTFFDQNADNLEDNTEVRDETMGGEILPWRFDVETFQDIKGFMKECVFDPTQVTCPMLSIIGEGEYQNRILQEQTENALKLAQDDRSTLLIPPVDEGGPAHCTWENNYLAAQMTFDWLDELFD